MLGVLNLNMKFLFLFWFFGRGNESSLIYFEFELVAKKLGDDGKFVHYRDFVTSDRDKQRVLACQFGGVVRVLIWCKL